jgi:hypothetical protein
MLCDAMDASRDAVVESIRAQSLAEEQPPDQASCIRALQVMDKKVADSFIRLLCQLIVTVMRTRNRPMMQQYAHTIAFLLIVSGFDNGLVSRCLFVIGEFLIHRFRARSELLRLTPRADEYITMTIHMAVDQIEDSIEMSRLQSPAMLEELKKMPPQDNSDLEKIVAQLEDLCKEVTSGQSWTSPMIQVL